ncbi:hypothetical protein ThrDRAFT_00040 [Frankia casuarinae]|uniref:histidine kinase n=2 Tax=Frankia casuarinae (strain DSM 45818 / CECT 9043 / HFP020203 / CcI3) TaxID=106370 RepID=Q2JGW3_FRACC|nr:MULTISPECIES: histidine kinase [Frankia]ABD09479.1 putative signal transduction histidine kinase [Frankia casuarinae]ETA02811.1 hypothetical protein CcI6DRAFT_01771 [Frankia sp. CcI6]EYT94116.1 hypothetical protein ThrDRAFT_00040 [Frankia casuarinae]TFE29116.1 two-component sensor histidine kinase [Frankia sp. B2]
MPHPRVPRRLAACAARHRSWCFGIGGVATTAGTVACQWPAFSDNPVTAGINVSVALTFVLTGVLLNGEDALGSATGAMIFSGLLWALTWTVAWDEGPSAFISTFAYTHFWVCLGWGALRYPVGRLQSNRERALLASAVLLIPVANLGLVGISDPTWFGYSRNVWWYGSPIDRDAFEEIIWVLDSLTLVLAAAFFWVVRVRLRRYSALDRRIFGPVAIALLVAFTLAATVNIFVCNPSGAYVPPAFILIALALLTIPLAFAAAGVRRQLARARIAQILATLPMPPTVPAVRDILRTALHDDSAELFLWMPQERRHVDADGATATPPRPGAGRLLVPVTTSSGAPLALISATAAQERNRDLVTVALQASAMALENARLHAAVAAQLDAVRASRARIVEAGLIERRRLERDLHDGVQQRLLALATRLGLARTKTSDPDTISAIEAAREDLHHALQDLRSLARGIHPAMLSQGGLRPALEVVIEPLPVKVEFDIPTVRFEPILEAGAYYTICEALTNTVKHAGAAQVRVTVRCVDGGILIEVTDDGKGGAVVVEGGGLAGLTDRVRALGGDLSIVSPSGGGTRLTASIPCG